MHCYLPLLTNNAKSSLVQLLGIVLGISGLNILGILGTILTIKYHRQDLKQLKNELATAERERNAEHGATLIEFSANAAARKTLEEATTTGLLDAKAQLDAEIRREVAKNDNKTYEEKIDAAVETVRQKLQVDLASGDGHGRNLSRETKTARRKYRWQRINASLLQARLEIREERTKAQSLSNRIRDIWRGRRGADDKHDTDAATELREIENRAQHTNDEGNRNSVNTDDPDDIPAEGGDEDEEEEDGNEEEDDDGNEDNEDEDVNEKHRRDRKDRDVEGK